MTRSQRVVALLGGFAAFFAAFVVFAVAATGAHHEESEGASHAGADPSLIEVVSTNVQGKNVFIPSTIVVAEGKPHTLTIFNTTDTPHGFKVDGLGIEFILNPGVETRVELPALEEGKIYRVHCQLHPPHRSAQLVVLDTD